MTENSSYKGRDKGRESGSYSGKPGKKSGPYKGKEEGSRDRGDKRPYEKREERGEKRPYEKRDDRGEKRPYEKRDDRGEKRPYEKREERGEKRPYEKRDDRGEKRPYEKREERGEKRPYEKRDDRGEKRPFEKRDDRGEKRPYEKRDDRGEKRPYEKRDDRGGDKKPSFGDRKPRFGDKKFGDKPAWKKDSTRGEGAPWKDKPSPRPKQAPPEPKTPSDGKIRLNKFIANSGVCSRREADMIITAGAVTVNGKIVNELGTKIDPGDVVVYDGQTLSTEKKVYVLLNKPKDFITTSDDPQGRNTVMELVKLPGNQRLFPVGRLDRNTTGLLLMTNDGELTKKLTHPRYGVRKLYHVVLDKSLSRGDMQKVKEGIEIDGQKVVPDEIEYVGGGDDKTQIGIELHSGQNRVVRRIFETLDYQVSKLDRVMFADLTKKDLARGQWRYLTDKEVSFLKMIQ